MRLSVVDRRSDGDVFTLVHRLPLSFRTQTFYLSLVVGAFVPRRLSELDGTITDEFSRHLLHRLGVAIDVQERDEPVPLILPWVRLIRDHLCLGETRILGERSRQHIVVTLVPQITDENPKIILGPLRQTRIFPPLSTSLPRERFSDGFEILLHRRTSSLRRHRI